MFKTLLAIGLCCCVSTAEAIRLEKINHLSDPFEYFDPLEVTDDLYIHYKAITRPDSQAVYHLTAQGKHMTGERVSICTQVQEVANRNTKLHSMQRSLYYQERVINASQIQSISPVSVDMLKTLGIGQTPNFEVGRLQLRICIYMITKLHST